MLYDYLINYFKHLKKYPLARIMQVTRDDMRSMGHLDMNYTLGRVYIDIEKNELEHATDNNEVLFKSLSKKILLFFIVLLFVILFVCLNLFLRYYQTSR